MARVAPEIGARRRVVVHVADHLKQSKDIFGLASSFLIAGLKHWRPFSRAFVHVSRFFQSNCKFTDDGVRSPFKRVSHPPVALTSVRLGEQRIFY